MNPAPEVYDFSAWHPLEERKASHDQVLRMISARNRTAVIVERPDALSQLHRFARAAHGSATAHNHSTSDPMVSLGSTGPGAGPSRRRGQSGVVLTADGRVLTQDDLVHSYAARVVSQLSDFEGSNPPLPDRRVRLEELGAIYGDGFIDRDLFEEHKARILFGGADIGAMKRQWDLMLAQEGGHAAALEEELAAAHGADDAEEERRREAEARARAEAEAAAAAKRRRPRHRSRKMVVLESMLRQVQARVEVATLRSSPHARHPADPTGFARTTLPPPRPLPSR